MTQVQPIDQSQPIQAIAAAPASQVSQTDSSGNTINAAINENIIGNMSGLSLANIVAISVEGNNNTVNVSENINVINLDSGTSSQQATDAYSSVQNWLQQLLASLVTGDTPNDQAPDPSSAQPVNMTV
jgi:hypothetical protein